MSESDERPTKIRRIEREAHPFGTGDQTLFIESAGGVISQERNFENEQESLDMPKDEERDDGDKDAFKLQQGESNAGFQFPMNETSTSQNPEWQSSSKRQLKKQRKREEWEANRQVRKDKRKEKHKAKQAAKAEQAADEKVAADPSVPIPRPPRQPYRRPILVPITFVLDCDFDELMTEKEITSLASQLSRCYSDNRSAPYKSHLVVSSFRGQLRKRFENVLANNHHGWKGVKFMDGDYVQAADDADPVMRGPDGGRLVGALAEHAKPEEISLPTNLGTAMLERAKAAGRTGQVDEYAVTESAPVVGIADLSDQAEVTTSEGLKTSSTPSLVYLTSDSPHTLTALSPYTTYVIGGLVDKNRHKGICYSRAMKRNISTARLPIGEYMTMQSRTVLTTNHVIEIMLRWLEDGDWAKAFLRVIPKRKDARLKLKETGQGTGTEKEGKLEKGHGGGLGEDEDEDGVCHEDGT